MSIRRILTGLLLILIVLGCTTTKEKVIDKKEIKKDAEEFHRKLDTAK